MRQNRRRRESEVDSQSSPAELRAIEDISKSMDEVESTRHNEEEFNQETFAAYMTILEVLDSGIISKAQLADKDLVRRFETLDAFVKSRLETMEESQRAAHRSGAAGMATVYVAVVDRQVNLQLAMATRQRVTIKNAMMQSASDAVINGASQSQGSVSYPQQMACYEAVLTLLAENTKQFATNKAQKIENRELRSRLDEQESRLIALERAGPPSSRSTPNLSHKTAQRVKRAIADHNDFASPQKAPRSEGGVDSDEEHGQDRGRAIVASEKLSKKRSRYADLAQLFRNIIQQPINGGKKNPLKISREYLRQVLVKNNPYFELFAERDNFEWWLGDEQLCQLGSHFDEETLRELKELAGDEDLSKPFIAIIREAWNAGRTMMLLELRRRLEMHYSVGATAPCHRKVVTADNRPGPKATPKEVQIYESRMREKTDWIKIMAEHDVPPADSILEISEQGSKLRASLAAVTCDVFPLQVTDAAPNAGENFYTTFRMTVFLFTRWRAGRDTAPAGTAAVASSMLAPIETQLKQGKVLIKAAMDAARLAASLEMEEGDDEAGAAGAGVAESPEL